MIIDGLPLAIYLTISLLSIFSTCFLAVSSVSKDDKYDREKKALLCKIDELRTMCESLNRKLFAERLKNDGKEQ